ncbi:MAG TPA: hypothetical protein VFK78_00855 [Gemmatimonadales bacterium]|nr:hypothetical protein [Gemmatimonadales bacterium]
MTLSVQDITSRRGQRLALWYLMAAASIVVTFVAGPFIQFPIAFVLPVALAAWFDDFPHALTLAVALPAIRFAFVFGLWSVPWSNADSLVNGLIRVAMLGLLAVLTNRVAGRHRALRREVAMLEKILPICSFCKKIRDQEQSWQPLEIYLRTHADVAFSHGLCPECARQHYPEYAD